MRKTIAVLAASIILLTGCGTKTDTTASSMDASSSAVAKASQSGTVNLTFWHAMGGTNEGVVKEVVQNFNDTIGKEKGIEVTPVFQGSYQDLLKKVKAAVQAKDTKNLPDIVQVPASDTAYIKDVPSIIWAQSMIDKDPAFNIADLEPNTVSSFSFKGKLAGVPFANSTVLLYYNKNMFKEAGLDPNKPPQTIDEMGQYAVKMTKRNGDQVTQWGLSVTPDQYHLSSWIGMQGGYIGNNKNGREDTMTQVEFDSTGTMKEFLTTWKKAVEYGGIQTGPEVKTNEVFAAGKLGMFLNSTAGVKGTLTAVGDKFEVGTAFLPKVHESDKGGVAVGGSALYLVDRGEPSNIDAAWEYMKYSTSPKTQFTWHTGTGYFPVNKKTYDLPEMKQHLEDNPLFKTAIEQLHASSPETQEPMNPVSGEFNRAIKDETLAYVTGKKDIDQAIKDMAAASNKALEDYNRVNKK